MRIKWLIDPMEFIDRFLDGARAVFAVLATSCLAVMLALNTVNILWRGIFDSAFNWVYPWTMLLFVWMIFLAMFVYLRDHRDVVVEVFVSLMPTFPRKVLAIFGDLLGLGVVVIILLAAPTLIGLQLGDMDAIALPQYLRSLPLFIASGFAALHFSMHAVGVVTGKTEAFPPHPVDQAETGAPE